MSEPWAIVISGALGGICVIIAAFLSRSKADINGHSRKGTFYISVEKTMGVGLSLFFLGIIIAIIFMLSRNMLIRVFGEDTYIFTSAYLLSSWIGAFITLIVLQIYVIIRGE